MILVVGMSYFLSRRTTGKAQIFRLKLDQGGGIIPRKSAVSATRCPITLEKGLQLFVAIKILPYSHSHTLQDVPNLAASTSTIVPHSINKKNFIK